MMENISHGLAIATVIKCATQARKMKIKMRAIPQDNLCWVQKMQKTVKITSKFTVLAHQKPRSRQVSEWLDKSFLGNSKSLSLSILIMEPIPKDLL